MIVPLCGCLAWFVGVAYIAERTLGDLIANLPTASSPGVHADCSAAMILRNNSLVACAMMAGRYLAFVPTILGLTVNAAISGIVFFPVIVGPGSLVEEPFLLYGLFEEGAFILIAAIVLSSIVGDGSERVWQGDAARVPFAVGMLLTGVILESRLCP